jgi:integrase
MGSIYPRGKKLWIKFKDVDGTWSARPTCFYIGEEKKAERLLESVEAKIKAGAELGEADLGPVTLARYTKKWIEERRAHVRTTRDEETRLGRHVLPRLGQMRLDEIRPRHLRDLILSLRQEGRLAPRSIRHIHALLKVLFRDAVVDELLEASPCVLKKGVLPKNSDKDPEWRWTAIFTREELEALISDEGVLFDRRVLYGLKGLAGLRHGEAAGLRWKHYDATAKPLGRLTVANSYLKSGTKTGVTREVPVHPTLAKLLAEWRLSGWPTVYGRHAQSEDLLVPTRRLQIRDKAEARNALQRDLKRLGLRPRRGHDLRRTFITLAQVDGARRDLLECVTHGPRGDIISIYSTFPWPALCAEVAKLNVEIRAVQVIEIPRAAEALGTVLGTVDKKGPDSRTNPSLFVVTPPGLEPPYSEF